MAGLFSLGGEGGGVGGGGGGGGGRGSSSGNQEPDQHHTNQSTEIPPPETLFWYKNDDVSSFRGFELWNQQQHHHHHQQQQQQQLIAHHARPLLHRDLYSSAAALGVGPSTASDEQSSPRSVAAFMAMRSAVTEVGGPAGGGISCQDCGNQAKKDCPHMRCRTCCKSRGYECQTHVKSTWVPAAKRRERQQQLASLQEEQHRDISKRPRDHANPAGATTSSPLACTRLPSSEQASFPSVVSSPAEFKCVRVSSIDDANDQYAYQTAVNIGGHVFKGILYDYGPDTDSNINNYLAGDSSSGGAAIVGAPQPLNLIAATATAAVVSSAGALVDPSSLYNPAPLNTFMAGSGTQFFPHPRS